MADDAVDLPEEDFAPKPSKLPLLIGVLNILLTGGVAALVLLKPTPAPPPVAVDAEAEGDSKAKKKKKKAPADGGPVIDDDEMRGPMVELRDIVVQLRNPEFDRYLKVSFQIELSDEDDIPIAKAAIPHIRDLFISYLADRTYEELRGQGGIVRTKHALMTRLKKAVSANRIRGLYITNMVVQ